MILSKNFRLEEFLVTSSNMVNEPPPFAIEKLLYLSQYILQPIRDKFGPLIITSGYRTPKVNASVGGNARSQHLYGEAADFVSAEKITGLPVIFDWIQQNCIFGQLILESKSRLNSPPSWIHVSLPRPYKHNQEALTYANGVYSVYNAG